VLEIKAWHILDCNTLHFPLRPETGSGSAKTFNVWQHHKIIKNFILEASPHNNLMTSVAKIIEIVGSSSTGWQDAAQVALNEAKKTIHGITGVEVGDMTAKVNPNSGNIVEYHTAVKIAFGVEHK
jgi:dodecin